MNIARQFVIYCLVGVVNTVAGLTIIFGLSAGLGWHYMAANAGGYAFGMALSFMLNRRITFRATAADGRAARQAGSFFAVLAAAYAVQLAALYVMVEWWRVPQAGAQVAAIFIYTITGFLGSRFIVFSGRARIPKT